MSDSRGFRKLLIPTIAVATIVGCPGRWLSVPQTLRDVTTDRLERFSSEKEFDAYASKVREARDQRLGFGVLFGCAMARAPISPVAPTSITNNQEQGVDEGDIVKASGDFLLLLRRGRIFSVSLGKTEGMARPVDQIDAHAPGFTGGSWYDEMLVHDDRIVVIGFSYEIGATEVGLFHLDRAGRLHHQATHFIRSNDYYSSRNYASRLVDGELILYMPYSLFSGGTSLPSKRSWIRGNRTTSWEEILGKVDVYRPVQPTLSPTLHTVVRCDLTKPELTCTSRAFVGPYSRSFYVSSQAVYVWVSSGEEAVGENESGALDSFVYRMPLGPGPVTAVRAKGAPIDQFSFKENAAADLDVLLVPRGHGDAMWGAESAQGSIALLHVPAEAFGPMPARLPDFRYTVFPAPASGPIQNRFVGDYLLWGTGSGWRGEAARERTLYVTSLARPGSLETVNLRHDVERIEPLGSAAAVVGVDGNALHLSTIRLDGEPEVRAEQIVPEAAQGETRSHGFFFLPEVEGGGVLGLPIRHDGGAWNHLRYGSAEILFLRVGRSLALAPLGALAAFEQDVDDHCEVSCVDWYGNARPIFYNGRVFALLGYELVEGHLWPEAIVESRRMRFIGDRAVRRPFY